ncbi:concanavalin A-like lectin/glucanase domain-containing protein [Hyaloscypha finlandica]|nr:concanavalin A-like lectin/glucanase domain-containing protein [Hyaloscypha finlandica]KAH8775017.1 concanavalin A-like lectin/glucanase domain-containing protein [Hyaloscypha sp. PMI_1271]
MSFFIGMIVNAILLSIPIGASLGTMIVIKPFRNERVKPPAEMNAIFQTTFCDSSHEFHQFAQNKNGVNYTINSNEFLPAAESTLCLTVTQNQNDTYFSNNTAPDFFITWEYPFTPANVSSLPNETKPLAHAFPQATLQDTALPITLLDLGALELEFSWTMGIGDEAAPMNSVRRLESQAVNATVALDLYLDADKDKAGQGGEAAFEMIIWFAKYGLFDPIGFGNGSDTLAGHTTLAGNDFDLYAGKNANLQNVFTWIASDPNGITDFKGDISPLFNIVLNLATTAKNFADLDVSLPIFGDYLGYVGFGNQVYSSIGHITFAVPKLGIDLQTFTNPNAPV